MSKCPNCNAQLSCGCQKRVTASGTIGCTQCIDSLLKQESNKRENTSLKDILFNNNFTKYKR